MAHGNAEFACSKIAQLSPLSHKANDKSNAFQSVQEVKIPRGWHETDSKIQTEQLEALLIVKNGCIEQLQSRTDRLRPLPTYVVVVIVVIVLGIGVFSWRYSRASRDEDLLFSQAAGRDFHGTEQSRAAIRKLATYRDAHSTALLLDIAQGNTAFQFDDLRIQAAKALKGRSGLQLSAGVAMLLQPHEGLELRQVSADDLQDMYCDHECLRLIMHYLERVWGGEANYEDHWNREPPPGTRDEQASVVQMLLSTLRREPRETTIMLSVTYGLGTASPSPFALELVKRAELTSSCQALLTSSERIKRLPPEVFRAPVLNFSKRLIRSSAELRIIRDRIRMLLCSAGKEHHTFVFEQFTIKRNYETIASFPSNYLNLTYG